MNCSVCHQSEYPISPYPYGMRRDKHICSDCYQDEAEWKLGFIPDPDHHRCMICENELHVFSFKRNRFGRKKKRQGFRHVCRYCERDIESSGGMSHQEWAKIRLAFRCKYNPKFRMQQSVRSHISNLARNAMTQKCARTSDLIGCSWPKFRAHIESTWEDGMTWDNWGRNGWHIDHIIPSSFFDYRVPAEQHQAEHYTNKRAMWGDENIRRSNKDLAVNYADPTPFL